MSVRSRDPPIRHPARPAASRCVRDQSCDQRVAQLAVMAPRALTELIDSKAGLAARALEGSEEEVASSSGVQVEALVSLLTDALSEQLTVPHLTG